MLDLQETRIRLTITRSMRIRLEPWADEFECPAGAKLEVVARGPSGDTLEFEADGDSITIYGWAGSIVDVLRDGTSVFSIQHRAG